MPDWPTWDGAKIIGLWKQDTYEAADVQTAFKKALTVANVYNGGDVLVPDSTQAVGYFKSLLNMTGEVDGIILFPFEGVDYTDCMREAAEKNIAVHAILSDMPDDIYREVLALYDIDNRALHLDGSTSWPHRSDAYILLLYRDSDALDDDQLLALNRAFGDMGYDYEAGHLGGALHSRDRAVETVKAFIERAMDEDNAALEAICLFPYEEVDYSAAVEEANAYGIAVHFVETADPDEIYRDICALYVDNN